MKRLHHQQPVCKKDNKNYQIRKKPKSLKKKMNLINYNPYQLAKNRFTCLKTATK